MLRKMVATSLAAVFFLTHLAQAQIEPAHWVRLSSMTGDLPTLPANDGMSGLKVVDLDKNGLKDYLITVWKAPETVIWYRHFKDYRFEKYIVEGSATPNLSHGEKFKDIDGDGDIDLIIGDAYRGNQIHWWENPYPNYQSDKRWKRRVVYESFGNFYHDMIWGDFDGDGSDELMTWNQKNNQLLLLEIPTNPKSSAPWPATKIFSWSGSSLKFRGADAVDINLDGKADFVGGGGWFEHIGGKNFIYRVIDAAMKYSQIKAGQLIPGGRPEVVCILELASGPLNMYEWTGAEWRAQTILSSVPRSHTLQLGDVNLDGHLDIMIGELGQWSSSASPPDNPKAKISMLYGDGAGNFTQQVVLSKQGALEGQLTDIDNDGDLDIVSKPFRHNNPRVDIFINVSNDLNDTIGLYDPAACTFYLKHSSVGTSGTADNVYRYGSAGARWLPIMGDWDGDGDDTAGLYDQRKGIFYLKNFHRGGKADKRFRYGAVDAGWEPVVGDWNNDGTDTVGLYNPWSGTFFLKNKSSGGKATYQFRFGPIDPDDLIPLAGDWDGDGVDTVGLYHQRTGIFYLTNSHQGGKADKRFRYGPANAGWEPVVGKWNGDGKDTIGLYDNGQFYLRYTNTPGEADLNLRFGPINQSWWPLAGKWKKPPL
ncbi:MAG: FG-GAP repeat domain-containing protein [Anaerolineales bacterium]